MNSILNCSIGGFVHSSEDGKWKLVCVGLSLLCQGVLEDMLI